MASSALTPQRGRNLLLLLLVVSVSLTGAMWNKKNSKSSSGTDGRKLYWYNEVSGASQWAEPKYEFMTGKYSH
jgi:hypothetical protein